MEEETAHTGRGKARLSPGCQLAEWQVSRYSSGGWKETALPKQEHERSESAIGSSQNKGGNVFQLPGSHTALRENK